MLSALIPVGALDVDETSRKTNSGLIHCRFSSQGRSLSSASDIVPHIYKILTFNFT